MGRKNTAAFVHEMPKNAIANVDGDSTYVRVQVLTNAGALDRDKADCRRPPPDGSRGGRGARSDASTDRTWVLLTEAFPPGGWGLWGHAHTNEEIVFAAKNEIAKHTRNRGV